MQKNSGGWGACPRGHALRASGPPLSIFLDLPLESLPLYRDMFWVRLFCRKESTGLEFNSILPKGRSSKNVKVSSYAGHPKTSVI